MPFSQLYDALGAGLNQEPSVLLLYVLLHKCHRFQQYVLVRSDADTILVPLLQRWGSQTQLLCISPFAAAGAYAAATYAAATYAAATYAAAHVANKYYGTLAAQHTT